MLPRWHIVLGAAFSFILGLVFPQIPVVYLLLVFFASFLIDFDHYLVAIRRTKSLSLLKSFRYYRLKNIEGREEKVRGIRNKGDFQIFHTIEFHILVGLLGLVWTPFVYVFIGMIFHSLLDIVDMMFRDFLYLRHFSFFLWLFVKSK